MYKSMIMSPEDVSLKAGDKVRLLQNCEIHDNSESYGFELNGNIDYDDYIDMDLEIVQISDEKIREDLVVVSLMVQRIDEEVEDTYYLPWFYYMLEVVEAKSQFVVELL